MNHAFAATPLTTHSRNGDGTEEKPELKKVVLLLGYSLTSRPKAAAVTRKTRLDVRPPERWGINE